MLFLKGLFINPITYVQKSVTSFCTLPILYLDSVIIFRAKLAMAILGHHVTLSIYTDTHFN